LDVQKKKKPYLINNVERFPNFNFNISHAGEWVTLGSEPQDIIGVDVMEVSIPRSKTDSEKLQFFETMNNCFTPFEWKNIGYSNSIEKQEIQFFRHWTLKEAYIKAVGIGLGFELQRAEFTLDNNEKATSATIRIDGKEEPKWKFDLDYLDSKHVVACAIGPPSEATENYKKTLKSSVSSINNIHDKHVPFKILQFKDLLQE